MGFSTRTQEKEVPHNVVEYKRDTSDNKLFKEIQVKDISTIITEDCIGAWDFDGVVYRIASNMENKLIRVVCKQDKTISEVLQNVTTFKGRGKKVSDTSWLGLKNVEREVVGLTPWTVEDFDIEPIQELKMEKEKALEQAKIQIFTKIKTVKQQYGIPEILPLLGEGDNFRMERNQCRRYKGQREDTSRPLLLKELRSWVMTDLKGEMAKRRKNGDNTEADDASNIYSQLGYQHYLKHGLFNYLELSPDKDALGGGGKLLINPDTHTGEHNPLKGKFKFPQALLIEATHKTAGDVELVIKGKETATKELKGWGFKFLIYQAILGKDQADNYNCLGHLGQKLNFGDVEAYKVLKPCKTAKETLQAAIDVAANLLPFGVQYTSHKGEQLDVDTLTYLDEYFATAYMLRSYEDEMTLPKLCKAFKVDTSAIEGNNKLTPPKRTFCADVEEPVNDIQGILLSLLNDELKSYKALKKSDLVDKLDSIKESITTITDNFEDSFYEMKQEEKL